MPPSKAKTGNQLEKAWESYRMSPAAIRRTRKGLAPSRDSAIPRMCKHAVKRPNSSRDRPRNVEPDYLARNAVLMCKPIKNSRTCAITQSSHGRFARYHATYCASPSAKGVFGLYPRSADARSMSAQVWRTSPGCSGNRWMCGVFPRAAPIASISSLSSIGSAFPRL